MFCHQIWYFSSERKKKGDEKNGKSKNKKSGREEETLPNDGKR